MQSYWRRFRKNKFFLLTYFFLSLCAFITIDYLLLLRIEGSLTDFLMGPFSFNGLYLLPLGLIIGVQIPALMHNCVHGNLRPRWMNILAGELAGVYILLGMAAFEINHRMHHVYADTELDPHNPEGKKFFKFFFANNFGGTEPVLRKHLEFHGDTKENRLIFKGIVLFHFLNVPARIFLWVMLLGPDLFLTFFVPSYLFHMFVFAHINYYTHKSLPDGTNEVYNMNSNLYYKFVNYFGSGVYYHKNHHKNPNIYNPMLGPSNSSFIK